MCDLVKYAHGKLWKLMQVRRSSKTWSLAKDRVLRPLAYLGLIELSPFPPHVHRRQAFSTLVLIAPTVLWYQSHK